MEPVDGRRAGNPPVNSAPLVTDKPLHVTREQLRALQGRRPGFFPKHAGCTAVWVKHPDEDEPEDPMDVHCKQCQRLVKEALTLGRRSLTA